jgi:hypothetical protein
MLKTESIMQKAASFHPQNTAPNLQKLFRVSVNIDLAVQIEAGLIKYRGLEAHGLQINTTLNIEMFMIDQLRAFYKNSPLESYGSLANNSNSQITGHLYNKIVKMPLEDVLYSIDNFNQTQFSDQSEKEFQSKIHQFYQNRYCVSANRNINSTFNTSVD